MTENLLKYINENQLVSYMNNTKWNEFRNAMINEMPFEPPYIYKLVDEEETGEYFSALEGDCCGCDTYDEESLPIKKYFIMLKRNFLKS